MKGTIAVSTASMTSPPNFIAFATTLDEPHRQQAVRLLDEVGNAYRDVQSVAFLEAAALIAQELPRPLREFLCKARCREEHAVFVIAARDIIGPITTPTPRDWRDVQSPSPAHRAEIFLVLVASLLGDVFGWTTQQNSRYVHDVHPMLGVENEQIGWSSLTPLTWHTEDAFHPHRADYLALLCLRNPDGVATTCWSVKNLDVDPVDEEVLWQQRFLIRPDQSHLPKYNDTAVRLFDRIEEMMRNPTKVSVLFGNRRRPYLRIDPDYMIAVPGDEQAARALAAISRTIERNLYGLVLRDGDLGIIDNFQVVHGRQAFRARFDGSDRWLKRVNIKRDLRQAAESLSYGSRLMT
jgi:Fe(II)/alpha-ketoglutarate-dependent arginine beta-hydroxylase